MVACRPCHRCTRRGAEPQRRLFALPRGRGPSQTPPSLATDSSISPGPPLSLAAGTAHGKAVLSVLRRTAGSHAQGTRLAGSVSAAGGLMPGRRGRAPGEINFGTPPSPEGKGGGGMGAGKQAKGTIGRQQTRQAPAGRVVRPHFPVPPGFSPRGCKGRSPLHKKTKNLPLPRRGRALCERGRGDGGRKAS